jgi:hypothetical protein
MRKLLAAFLGVWILLAQPAVVMASAYSAMNYGGKWFIPGGTTASKCGQSGIVDVAKNYMQTVSRNFITGSCAGGSHTVPSGFLGTSLYGYKDGSSCGGSGIYYSTVATSAWQLWITMCSNPAGTQAFKTLGYGWFYNSLDYDLIGGFTSPIQNY